MMHKWLNEQQRSLSSLLKQNRVPHAFIISGADGTGKLLLAQWLIGILACEKNGFQEDNVYPNEILQQCGECKSCQLLKGHGHPDHLVVDTSGNSIGVDQIRQVTTFFEKTALLGRNQSAIIEAADTMTESAANALLKTLEEPTANSHIILLTTEISRLLPTIISRCRQISIRATDQELNNNIAINYVTTFASLKTENVNGDTALLNEFMLLFYQFLANPEERSRLLLFMQTHTQSLNWCEGLIADLMRYNQGWLNNNENTAIDQQILARLQHLTHDDIWQVQLLISACKKQILLLTQANRNFQIEKLLAQMTFYLIQAYAVDR
ncbi:hypothetical protein [Thalassotalea profundi]|uniref:DNA-directed DNA polymerase n=1 Tax=Thalassotalea profundi TaxID=2036687 RepID=A0ABQ3ITQ8_9GAMM|nr:hypothetical protein [Thalassotalea profundi]GHE90699.1 hypothetical protein GCM10011501_20130 [Thalassotalea profundi]